jgi:glycosyltransferase involved in cell wall biosynthesis
VQVAGPAYYHGNDLRPVTFAPLPGELCPASAIPAYLTRFVHVFFYGWKSLRRVVRGDWDVIHAWEEPYILAGAELAAAAPRRSRFVFRTAQSLNKRYLPPFNLFESYTLRRAAGWICSGRLVEENLSRRVGYAPKPHRVIPLGVDADVFRPSPAAGAAVRRELGWEEPGPPVVGYLGRFVPEKGTRLLTRALELMGGAWRALFVGAGPLEPELGAWAARYPARVRICTEVAHDAVPRYLNAMDVLAAPSQTTPRWKEQFGRMLIEAMACGVPVVGSDSGEIPFVIGGAGVVLPEADPSAWATGLGELLESPVRRAELAAAGLARAHADFAWPVVARKHLDFFDELLDVPQ